ncbi:MAG: PAS domain S-box protein [Deltaproteobacteria bacterium]|nr:MAG: PAS domain S-box protein [Deltaproteobacteria bacterium]
MELDFRKDPTILSKIVDAMADGVFTVDAHGNFVAWSEGAERITGYRQEEVIGRPCTILEGPNCKGFHTLSELLGNPSAAPVGICNQECKVLSRDGRELYLHGNVRLLHDEQGAVIGAVGTFTDLTSFVQANEKISLLEEQTRHREAFEQMIGKSRRMQEIFRRLRLAAQSDVTVLLTGESGTGKEVAAAAIHAQSARRDKPFLAVNCSAIPEALLESELFGHVKGAFTGAVRDKIGIFEQAHGGTLFLDEIGDVAPMLQLKLLRVIQEQEIRRVGDERGRKVDVRLITATNRNLQESLRSGTMREDFYYRIRVFEITLPPLRERREDIPLLIRHFIEKFSKIYGKEVRGIARDALQRMIAHPWPGNVRELENAIEHAFVTVTGEKITLLDLPEEIRNPQRRLPPLLRHHSPPQRNDGDLSERERIEAALAKTGGNRTQAAELLGYSRVTLWKKMKKFGLIG